MSIFYHSQIKISKEMSYFVQKPLKSAGHFHSKLISVGQSHFPAQQ